MEHKKVARESDEDERYPEPPELRRAGYPPLMKIVKKIAIAIGIALIIVLAFSLYYYFSNPH